MKSFLSRLWARFKAPIVFVFAALGALLLVVFDSVRLGKRLAARKQAKEDLKDELEEIDALADAGDAAGLRERHLRRAKEIDPGR